MSKLVYIGITLMFVSFLSNAQNDETQIREVINRLFKGMQLSDSAMVRSSFVAKATLVSAVKNKENHAVLRYESLDNFLKAVGTPHAEPWNEEIWNVEVKIDSELAQVWCEYAFYVGKKFSHCGVDAFQLHKSKDGWQIFHLADTRRTTDCDVPSEVSKKYN